MPYLGLVGASCCVGGLIDGSLLVGSSTGEFSGVSNSYCAVTSNPVMDSCCATANAVTGTLLPMAATTLLGGPPFFH